MAIGSIVLVNQQEAVQKPVLVDCPTKLDWPEMFSVSIRVTGFS